MTNPLNFSAETQAKLDAEGEKFRNKMNAIERSMKRDRIIFNTIKLAIVVGGVVAIVKTFTDK